ncbi:hypothetical protein ACWOA0_01215 [Ignavigranum ruoffiae]|uniref:Amino acid transporter, AAT family n=1 Tax=Ignavigranum ruoffiae TaxID=89093 RepID=A0A1H8ZA29_9LACT|nr:hypothetical protein [Ignavigranum ruoffiae]UPQ85527.1 hypothetical protein M0R79_07700 [Ignavigranum ruoffiae]SEP61256.1 amino acid transporter, AAT family [Ignavigranum ruoffiae]
MTEFINKKRFDNTLVNGLVAFISVFITANVFWIVFSQLFKFIFTLISGSALNRLSPELASAWMTVAVEGAFFWLVITPWIWMALNLGNPGKYDHGIKQPGVGLRYLLRSMLWGLIAFFVFTIFLGFWWEPFSLTYLFRPENDQAASIAIKSFTALNFFALAAILAQIPSVSLFGKWPAQLFTDDPKTIGFINFSLSLGIAILVWLGIMIPGFMEPIEYMGQAITRNPWGGWHGELAWFQLFILFFLIPAEGFALYPQRWITRKQPWSGLVGLVIAMLAAFVLHPVLKTILAPIASAANLPDNDLMVASFALSIINVMLTWHQLFEDYPHIDQVGGHEGRRILRQFIIVIVLGSIFGLIWPFIWQLLPLAGNDLGLGHPVLGLIAGHFVYMMPMLYTGTGFDRWPVNQNVDQ